MSISEDKAPKPGLYADIAFEDYWSWPYANNSTLQVFERSAAHARLAMLSPREPTPALDCGHKFHLAILEPDRFDAETVLALDLPRRKDADKAAHAAFAMANAGKYILTQDELTQIRAMQAAVQGHPVASAILNAKGMNEVGAIWDDDETKTRCKSRQDMLREYVGYPFIFDLKTTENASRGAFSRAIHKYKYHQQGAFYVDGLKALGQDGVRFALIAVEKDAPFGVACYELDDVSLDLGRSEYRENLRKYAKCMESGEWPSYSPEMDYIGVPHWAQKQFSEGD